MFVTQLDYIALTRAVATADVNDSQRAHAGTWSLVQHTAGSPSGQPAWPTRPVCRTSSGTAGPLITPATGATAAPLNVLRRHARRARPRDTAKS